MKRALLAFVVLSMLLPAAAYAGPELKLEGLRYDFGRVKHGEVLTHEFKFTNIGDEDLIIEKLVPS